MQLKIIFSSSEEKQTLDSVSLIWFDVILVFANAFIWNIALVLWILNVFSANRVTDPSLSFFSQFWQCLSLPPGLASPSNLSLSMPVASSPTFCGAEHPVITQRDLRALVTRACEFVRGHRQRVIALRAPLFWFLMVLFPPTNFGLYGLALFWVSAVSASSSGYLWSLLFCIFWLPPPPAFIPCNRRVALFLHLNWFVGAQPLGYSVLWSLSAWRVSALTDEWRFSLHLVKSSALFFITTCRILSVKLFKCTFCLIIY